MKDKKKLKIAITVCLVLVFILVAIFTRIDSKDDNKNDVYTSYKALISVDYVDKKDVQRRDTLKIFDDGKNAIADLSFSENTVYMTKDETIYSDKGEYKTILHGKSYKDFYKIVSSLDLGTEVSSKDTKKTYNPHLDSQTINAILDSINLGKNTEEERNALVVTKEGKIENFSLYLTEIEGYKRCNITATFSRLEKEPVEIPKIYKELSSEGKREKLFILKE